MLLSTVPQHGYFSKTTRDFALYRELSFDTIYAVGMSLFTFLLPKSA